MSEHTPSRRRFVTAVGAASVAMAAPGIVRAQQRKAIKVAVGRQPEPVHRLAPHGGPSHRDAEGSERRLTHQCPDPELVPGTTRCHPYRPPALLHPGRLPVTGSVG